MEIFGLEAYWDKTAGGVDRIRKNPAFEEPDADYPHPRFEGKIVIARDRPINHGVYLGGGGREAIVVDDIEQEKLRLSYLEYLRVLQESTIRTVFEDTLRFVQEKMPYNSQYADFVRQQLNSTDQLVPLSVYLGIPDSNGLHKTTGGICRHQALFGGYLLEKAIQSKLLEGSVSIDRNYIPGLGGHGWVRYTDSNGYVTIIDPALSYVGPLPLVGFPSWNYRRPEDD